MDDTPRAEDIRPGEIIAYTPTSANQDADPVGVYVTATQRSESGRILVLGGHFPAGVFVRVHRAFLPARHPITIMRTRWVTTAPGASLLHVQGEGETATVCERTGAIPKDLGPDPSRTFAATPVCRTCAYRAVRQAVDTERYDPAPFFYDLP